MIDLRSASEAGVDLRFEDQDSTQKFTSSTVAGHTKGILRAPATENVKISRIGKITVDERFYI